ncbi:MAG: hypothetical protein RLY86_3336 [Pseudomonadota bacterium]|jgi:hypothetical protein
MSALSRIHPIAVLLVLLLGGGAWLFFSYGTLDRCAMMRLEVRSRFPDRVVPDAVRQSPGGGLVVGLVEGTGARFLTYDMRESACMLALPRLWFAEDTELGTILQEAE